MSMKWLPNALTILRCGLAFVVGWTILDMGAALNSLGSSAEAIDGALQKAISATIMGGELGDVERLMEGMKRLDVALWPPFVLFVLVAATDFLDGYAARKLNAVSDFGAFLDPIADKLLVAISLLALCYITDWSLLLLLPTIAIVARDLFVTLIRLRPNISLPVSKLAKWKTALEMIGIGGYLFGFALFAFVKSLVHPDAFEGTLDWLDLLIEMISVSSLALICLAAALSLYTGALYIRAAFAKTA